MTDKPIKELRLSGSSTILAYLKRFSATEKLVFGILAIAAVVTALMMSARANSYFMTEVPARGGEIHEGLVGLPHTVNPVLAVTDVDRDIAALVYAGLTKTKGNAIAPDLAEKWAISEDGLTYTFDLKPDLKFQDGSALTAEDVVFTINKIKDYALKSPRAADWAGVTAQATSPKTVVFNLKQPYSSFLANTTVGILPKSIWRNVTDEQFIFSDFNIKPIGAGPCRVSSIKRDQGGIPTEYRLEDWSGYHAEPTHVSSIVFTFFPDLDHALAALDSGAIGSLSSIPPAVAKELSTNKGEPYIVEAAPLTRIFGVFFNQNKNSILADAVIRKAMDMATNRKEITDSVLSGFGVPTTSAFPPGFDIASASTTPPSGDLQGALALLNKNGWKISPTGVLEKKANKKAATTTVSFSLYTADTSDLKQVADILKSQWQKIGITVTVKVLPPTELYQSVIRTREYDALLFGQVVGRSSDFYAFWHSSQRNSPGLNVSLYTNSKADKILESMRTATSTSDKNALYSQLDQMIREDVPAIFLYSPELTYAVPKDLKGLRLGVMNAPMDRFQNISDWYMRTEKVWDVFTKR